MTLRRPRAAAWLIAILGCTAASQTPPQPETRLPATPILYATQSNEEFVGPFSGWRNIRNEGAIGDGVADDTGAFQRALTDLGRGDAAPVLFVPAGRYRLTSTLTLADRLYITIVGEDPATTTLVWDGAAGGAMLAINGVAYSRFGRLTFDGRGTAGAAVDQAWDGSTGPFDTGNEYADMFFTDVEFGIRGGFKGHGFAETSIVRAHFLRNRQAGVALGNFNALDAWIRQSTFEECGAGVTNDPGAGNFRVYDSLFRRSSVADLVMQNTGVFSVRGNYSIGSRAFFVSGPAINHPANIDITRNTIVDSAEASTIRVTNQGPGFVADNIVRTLDGQGGPIVSWRSRIESDIVSAGNTFTAARSVTGNGRFMSLDDRIVPRSSIAAPEPVMPPTPPNRHREVIEVPRGADAAAIQRAIAAAVARTGNRPVVHVPSGTYAIATTLTLPPSDVQIVGDGARTVLKWSGPENGGPVLAIEGPTRVTLRELSIEGTATADAVAVRNVDQDAARIYADGLQLRSARDANLFVDRLQRARLELVDVGHAYMSTGTSILLHGGKTTIFSGASSGNSLSYDVSDGATLVARDIWYEGDAPRGFARIHGRAAATFQSVRVATPAEKGAPAFVAEDLDGALTILSTHLDDRVVVSGDGRNARVLVLGAMREYQAAPPLVSDTSRGARVVQMNNRQRTRTQGMLSAGTTQLPDSDPIDRGFVRGMLEDARATGSSSSLDALPPSTTDLRMFRVWIINGRNNVVIR